jgi:NhaP-type Na+/H+ or K+/H+ antiporter
MIELVMFQTFVIPVRFRVVFKINSNTMRKTIEAVLRLKRIVVSIEWTKDGYFIKSVHSDLDYKTRQKISYRRAYL